MEGLTRHNIGGSGEQPPLLPLAPLLLLPLVLLLPLAPLPTRPLPTPQKAIRLVLPPG